MPLKSLNTSYSAKTWTGCFSHSCPVCLNGRYLVTHIFSSNSSLHLSLSLSSYPSLSSPSLHLTPQHCENVLLPTDISFSFLSFQLLSNSLNLLIELLVSPQSKYDTVLFLEPRVTPAVSTAPQDVLKNKTFYFLYKSRSNDYSASCSQLYLAARCSRQQLQRRQTAEVRLQSSFCDSWCKETWWIFN